MRIVYVCDGLSPWVIGGMQVVSSRHVRWLSKAGHNVTVVSSHQARLSSGIDLAHELVAFPWPRPGRFARIDPWRYVRQLQAFSRSADRVIENARPDLVYSEGPLVDFYLRRNLASRAPVIFHPHGLEMFQRSGSRVMDLRLRPMRSIIRRHGLRASKSISQGGQLDDILASQIGVPQEGIAHLPNSAPEDFPEPRQSRQNHSKRFLFVGRDEVRKGLPMLLRALRRLPDAKLDVVGVEASRYGKQSNVVFHGSINDRDGLYRHYLAADYLVVPSLAEGMPTVILEAFAAGLPVIAADVGAVAELVRNEVTGFLVPRGDEAALAAVLKESCCLDDATYAEMSAKAIELARTEFSPERVREMFLSIVAAAAETADGTRTRSEPSQ